MITRRRLFKALLALPAVVVVGDLGRHYFGQGQQQQSFSDIVTAALKRHRHELADNVTQRNALYERIKKGSV